MADDAKKHRRGECEQLNQEIRMRNILSRFLAGESGATAIEYGLIAALISVAIIGGAQALGTALNDEFSCLARKVHRLKNSCDYH